MATESFLVTSKPSQRAVGAQWGRVPSQEQDCTASATGQSTPAVARLPEVKLGGGAFDTILRLPDVDPKRTGVTTVHLPPNPTAKQPLPDGEASKKADKASASLAQSGSVEEFLPANERVLWSTHLSRHYPPTWRWDSLRRDVEKGACACSSVAPDRYLPHVPPMLLVLVQRVLVVWPT